MLILFVLFQRQTGEAVVKSDSQGIRFDRKLLDFDYDDEDDENASPNIQPPLANPVVAMDPVGR